MRAFVAVVSVCLIVLGTNLFLVRWQGADNERVGANRLLYTATSSSSFIGSLGVNLHVSWPNVQPYANTAAVMNAMNYLGIHNARD